MNNHRRSLLLAAGWAVLWLTVTPARAELYEYGFSPILNSTGYADDLAPQLSFQVRAMGSAQVLFTIYNNNPISPGGYYQDSADLLSGSFITGVFFDTPDTGPALRIVDLIDADDPLGGPYGPAWVDFTTRAGGTLPQGNALRPPFDSTFQAGKDKGARFGINSGEYLGIVLSGMSLTEVIGALEDHSLRVGLHVQGLPTINPPATSDAFINVAPLPAAVLLGMLGLGAASWKLRKHT